MSRELARLTVRMRRFDKRGASGYTGLIPVADDDATGQAGRLRRPRTLVVQRMERMHRFKCVAAVLLAVGLAAPAGAAISLRLVSDENAPFASTDPVTKNIVGITAEMAAEATRRAGVTYTSGLFPWARAYYRAQTDADTCVYPVARLPEREQQFQWIGPLSKNKWMLFGRADFAGAVANLEEAKKYRIGGLVQDGPSVYLHQQGVSVELVGSNELNLNKLLAGRIELWATGYFRGKMIAAKANVADLKPVFMIQEVDHYLACNNKMPAELVKSLNQAVDSMWRDGWMKKILDRYQAMPTN